jgi:hypothetical protein
VTRSDSLEELSGKIIRNKQLLCNSSVIVVGIKCDIDDDGGFFVWLVDTSCTFHVFSIKSLELRHNLVHRIINSVEKEQQGKWCRGSGVEFLLKDQP